MPKGAAKGNQIEEEKGEVTTVITTVLPALDDFVDGLGTWKDALKDSWSQKYFNTLYAFLKGAYSKEKVYPPPSLVFNAFKLTPINKIRVVIIGQDPYHQPGQAMGLSFSVPKGIKIPPSLLNIYKSLESDPNMKGFKRPNHGDLTKWAEQGVFMLNAVLTVQDSNPNSHKKEGWNTFTDAVVKAINKECNNVVFMLWGKDAEKKATGVDEKKHHVLRTSHPSGLSYTKGFDKAYHFSKCNDYLKKNGLKEIDWTL